MPVPPLQEVYSIFNHCPLHDLELKTDTVPIVNGNNYTPRFTVEEEKTLFPLSNIKAPRDLDRINYPDTVDVLYCSECRKEELKNKKLFFG